MQRGKNFGLKRNHFIFCLNQTSTKWQIVYVSGHVAISAEVQSDCRM